MNYCPICFSRPGRVRVIKWISLFMNRIGNSEQDIRKICNCNSMDTNSKWEKFRWQSSSCEMSRMNYGIFQKMSLCCVHFELFYICLIHFHSKSCGIRLITHLNAITLKFMSRVQLWFFKLWFTYLEYLQHFLLHEICCILTGGIRLWMDSYRSYARKHDSFVPVLRFGIYHWYWQIVVVCCQHFISKCLYISTNNREISLSAQICLWIEKKKLFSTLSWSMLSLSPLWSNSKNGFYLKTPSSTWKWNCISWFFIFVHSLTIHIHDLILIENWLFIFYSI